MGYQFAGFFAPAGPDVLDAALAAWPECRGRLIAEPFRGIGVAVPSRLLTRTATDEDEDRAEELAWSIEQNLPEWTRMYPAIPFVYLRAECFGGVCLYSGHVCQNGVMLERAEDPDEGGDALVRLVRALGVELGPGRYFEPFTRGFFDG
jgi:hypothetical protein